MSDYYDKYGRIHDKVCKELQPSSNNGWIYSAYAHKMGIALDFSKLTECFKLCKQLDEENRFYLIRSPFKETPPMSRDEILGMAYLGFLKPEHLDGWSFSPYKLPKFNLFKLLKQIYLLKDKHRNYFWQNNLNQIYRFAFSVPLQDRYFILKCFGKEKNIFGYFYKFISFIDSKVGKPKNGISWLKHGGEERRQIMMLEFPQDHPLRN